jgi:ribosomal protein S18 acetylase RimI-like enzyme
MTQPAGVDIRPYQPADREQVMALAPRLTEWTAPWREPAAVSAAVHGWIRDAVDGAPDQDHAVYVAVQGDTVAGVVTVGESTHYTGQVDAYVGELAVATGMERRGIATRLMTEAERRAAARGRSFLTLHTGAANQPARRLYASLGFREDDVRLTKALGTAGGQD